MKPVAALIAPSQVDVDLLVEQCIVGYADLLGIEKRITRTRAQLDDQIAAAKTRRLQLGQWLAQARDTWPARGPNAKGWGEFLERIKIPDSTARSYIAEFRDPQGFAERKAGSAKTPEAGDTPDDPPAEDDDGQTGAKVPDLIPLGDKPPFRQLTADEIIERRRELNDSIARLTPKERKRVLAADKVNLQGGSGEVERGSSCTPRDWAKALGLFQVDAFCNERSHIAAVDRCIPEHGGDGFGGGKPGESPGLYLVGAHRGMPPRSGVADRDTTVFIQPVYAAGFVERAIAHYAGARFTALLRWSPDTAWWRRMWPLLAAVAIPLERIEFEPPPGITFDSTISYPHAIYYACKDDVTDAIRERCIVLDVDHGRCDPASLRQTLRLVE